MEQWVHEIKLPVTGIRLLCENQKTDLTRKILSQTERIGQDVEKVLFLARLGSVEKDFLIQEISLRECVMEALARNKYFLIESGACVHTENLSHAVRSDRQWIVFLLNQFLSNSLKYRNHRPLTLTIGSEDTDTHVILSFSDNGVGIRPSELGRIFDKGFVGSNGRSAGASGGSGATGMGLFICAGLCERLGIGIDAESDWRQSATFRLLFPKGPLLEETGKGAEL